jgi:hypothetical protein
MARQLLQRGVKPVQVAAQFGHTMSWIYGLRKGADQSAGATDPEPDAAG